MNQTDRPVPARDPAADSPHVLIVDDDIELCELLAIRIAARGFRVSAAHGVKTALDRLGAEHVDAVLLDLRLADGDGFDVLDAVAKRTPEVPVTVVTAHGSIEAAVEAMRRGAFGFVTKPFHDHDLMQKLAHAVERHRLRREVAGLRRVVGGAIEEHHLVGVSVAIEQVRETVARVAPTDATVLVLGESGTGKELVARSLHALSPRAKGPFIAVNCAALAADLLESTLFGHVRGAFTGAVNDRDGLFGAARRGTLFLDEIGEAAPSVQGKLLRVLQERRFTKVGSNAELEADVRLVAATNRDLRQEVAERRFREDLFYRLHVVPISMPPLRERSDDVMLLAEMFMARAAARHGFGVPRFNSRALQALVGHSWPGNVRELANAMEAAVLLATNGEIDVEHLPGIGVLETAAGSQVDDIAAGAQRLLDGYAATDAATLPTLRDAREAFERAYLDTVLARAGGNVAQAARIAGRNRTDFYDLMRRHGRTAASFKKADAS